MKSLGVVSVWLAVALVAALSALNWPILSAPAALNLGVATVEAPLGIVLLGLSAALAIVFFVAYTRNRIGTLLEKRSLLKELQRTRELADKAEASRIEGLHRLITAEFSALHERLDSTAGDEPGRDVVGNSFRPLGFTQILAGHGPAPSGQTGGSRG